MTIRQRALTKTAFVLGLIAIIIAISTVWPAFLVYSAATIIVGLFVFMIYGMFVMHEESKDWRKRD